MLVGALLLLRQKGHPPGMSINDHVLQAVVNNGECGTLPANAPGGRHILPAVPTDPPIQSINSNNFTEGCRATVTAPVALPVSALLQWEVKHRVHLDGVGGGFCSGRTNMNVLTARAKPAFRALC